MKKFLPGRIGLTLVFSLFVFSTFLITMCIVGAISFAAIHSGVADHLGQRGLPVVIFSVLLGSIIVGTLLAPLLSRIPLRPVRQMIAATNRLAAGDFSVRLDIARPPEMHELANSFNRMASELGGIEVLRTDFINNFSHEFKTPIVSIRGFAQMLKYGDLTPEERDEYLDIVISESSRLAELATNVLELSKVENQQILTDRREFNLGEQVRRCALLLESKWERKQLELNVEVDDLAYWGNEDLLSQVWLNLLDNAVKFTPPGGRIDLSLHQVAEWAVFCLRDSGPGVGAEQLPHIFDKFYQGDTSHASPGNGLGLTVARRVVELHRGVISCRSEAGRGAEFTVRLPLGGGGGGD